MRLTEKQVQIIKSHFASIFDQNTTIHLFGSRTDDQKKGGDIDLLIKSNLKIEQPAKKCAELVAKIQMSLGEQKIDVITIDSDTILTPFHQQALNEAIAL